jgi:hypothetical protein
MPARSTAWSANDVDGKPVTVIGMLVKKVALGSALVQLKI